MTRTGDREIRSVSGRLPDNPGELACMAVGPSLLSATDLASQYGIEGGICRPLNHMRHIPRLLTASQTALVITI